MFRTAQRLTFSLQLFQPGAINTVRQTGLQGTCSSVICGHRTEYPWKNVCTRTVDLIMTCHTLAILSN
ncbi:hypothetical protein LMH87_002318 [Akanthomyces muscarius]|uniref:Uncharacterized protein n=1 Tax=Akanthomyces muscarius TaxID=2231603 RepID=A0A9W8UGZ0_AKAMU|nr:hypothetical protein LMH87_002318 [Akanthomyces muscarius]KAJ4147816.1 hypothetical protein LMH87_002318 [Akanthomyces muscarius]